MTSALTSTRNPRVAAARRLLRRSHRSKERAFLLEGRAAILDVLSIAPERVREIFVLPDEDDSAIPGAAADAGVEVLEVSPQVLAVLTETVTPQGVVAVAESPEVTLDELPPDPQTVLVLIGVSDPGNAGTLLRTAAAAGADAAIFSENSVDPLNPKVVRASASALFLVPFVRDAGVQEVAAALRATGCALLGAATEGRNVFTEVDLTGPTAFFVGNESGGLPASVQDVVDEMVAIPMPGRIESLNAGIAGSILLFEAVRRRRFDD